jgi:replication factor A1
VNEVGGQWHCDKCDRSYPNSIARYILSLMVCDSTGNCWLTAFDDAAKVLLGGTTAQQLNELLEQGNKETGQ